VRLKTLWLIWVAALLTAPLRADLFSFTTGAPDGRMATASRPGLSEIESADDFITTKETLINNATFVGLLPSGLPLSSLSQVVVEIYRVFPKDSTTPPDGRVPTRNNSPSDVAFDTRDSLAGALSFTATLLNTNFTVANTVLNGINPSPNQTTGGEGPVSGEEVSFNVSFTTPFDLQPDHYFFVPQVSMPTGDFLWLSTPSPPLFTGDLQTWIRNQTIAPDWLRVGTDIVGSGKFNASFSLSGETVPEPSSYILLGSALSALVALRKKLLRG